MSTKHDLEFHYKEHWPIDFEVLDGDGDAIDITAATLQWRMVNAAGTTVMTRTAGDGLTVTSGSAGLCTLLVTPTHQTDASVAQSTRYQWEFKVTTSGGTSSVQARGELVVLPSLFA